MALTTSPASGPENSSVIANRQPPPDRSVTVKVRRPRNSPRGMPLTQLIRCGACSSSTLSLNVRFGSAIDTISIVPPCSMRPAMLTTERFQSA